MPLPGLGLWKRLWVMHFPQLCSKWHIPLGCEGFARLLLRQIVSSEIPTYLDDPLNQLPAKFAASQNSSGISLGQAQPQMHSRRQPRLNPVLPHPLGLPLCCSSAPNPDTQYPCSQPLTGSPLRRDLKPHHTTGIKYWPAVASNNLPVSQEVTHMNGQSSIKLKKINSSGELM